MGTSGAAVTQGAAAGAAKRRRRRGRARARAERPAIAVVDLGTNNCRLLIAEVTREGAFRIVDSFSRIVRLGEGVARTGALGEDAIARTIDALRICAERIARHRVKAVRAIATEACRRARNAAVLVDRVKAETGLTLDIVSTEEEARLAALGCAPLIGQGYEGALVFDIGGGSTELIWLARGETVRTLFSVSVPVGVVNLAEEEGHGADRAGYLAMRARLETRLEPLRARMAAIAPFDVARHHLLGTSGTVTTLAGIALGLARYDRARVDASWHDCRTILGVIDRVVGLDLAGRAKLGCVGPERADLIVPGSAIFAATHALWPCARLRVADRGLREGMLRELAAEIRSS